MKYKETTPIFSDDNKKTVRKLQEAAWESRLGDEKNCNIREFFNLTIGRLTEDSCFRAQKVIHRSISN